MQRKFTTATKVKCLLDPLVSVIMPAKVSSGNSLDFLRKSISSIVSQTYRNFEFLIIAGSEKDVQKLVELDVNKDNRIQVYPEEGQGLINALNQGCSLAKGKYIARMDADDISLPKRFERQVRFLEEHPEIGVLGTWATVIDSDDRIKYTWRTPIIPELISWALLFENCVAHSSVMMRREVVKCLGFYKPEMLYSEDHDLWARATLVSRIANLPQPLVKYRETLSNTTSLNSKEMIQRDLDIMCYMISRIFPRYFSVSRTKNLFDLVVRHARLRKDRIEQALSYLKLLEESFESRTNLNERGLISNYTELRIGSMILMSRDIPFRDRVELYVRARRLFPRLSLLPIRLASRDSLYDLLSRVVRF